MFILFNLLGRLFYGKEAMEEYERKQKTPKIKRKQNKRKR